MLVAFTTPLATLVGTAARSAATPAGRPGSSARCSVGLAVALLVAGAVGDDYGRRRMLVLGAARARASRPCSPRSPRTPWCWCSPGSGRGSAARRSSRAASASSRTRFPAGPERARATGVWGATVGAGIAAGPLVMGWLDELVGLARRVTGCSPPARWRWSRSSAGCCSRSARDSAAAVDVGGALLLGGGLVALLAGLVEGRLDWGRPAYRAARRRRGAGRGVRRAGSAGSPRRCSTSRCSAARTFVASIVGRARDRRGRDRADVVLARRSSSARWATAPCRPRRCSSPGPAPVPSWRCSRGGCPRRSPCATGWW